MRHRRELWCRTISSSCERDRSLPRTYINGVNAGHVSRLYTRKRDRSYLGVYIRVCSSTVGVMKLSNCPKICVLPPTSFFSPFFDFVGYTFLKVRSSWYSSYEGWGISRLELRCFHQLCFSVIHIFVTSLNVISGDLRSDLWSFSNKVFQPSSVFRDVFDQIIFVRLEDVLNLKRISINVCDFKRLKFFFRLKRIQDLNIRFDS